jgi:hypothetical protein
VLVAVANSSRVGRPAIGDHAGAGLDVGIEERRKALSGRVGGESHVRLAEVAVAKFARGREERLSKCSSARYAWLRTVEVALVGLHIAAQVVAAGTNDNRPVAVRHRPRGLDRSQFHVSLQLGPPDADLADGHQTRGGESDAERRTGLVEGRSRRGGHLAVVACAFPACVGEPPGHCARTVRAVEALRPAEPVQIVEALRVLGEPHTHLGVQTREVWAADRAHAKHLISQGYPTGMPIGPNSSALP